MSESAQKEISKVEVMTEIYIEWGTTRNATINTGIQRVVRNIVNESESIGRQYGIKFIQVALHAGELFIIPATEPLIRRIQKKLHKRILLRGITAINNTGIFNHSFLARIKFALKPWVLRYVNSEGESYGLPIKTVQITGQVESDISIPSPSRILLLLDSTWSNEIWSAVVDFRKSGGHVCSVLYDLIPFTHPETVAEATRIAHTQWWIKAPMHIDSIMCISSSVRDDYLRWQEVSKIERRIPPEKVSYFHLGADFKSTDPVIEIFNSNKPFFLVVGSLEPRKNHSFIIDAFDRLWSQNKNINLVIVGGYGWKSEGLIDRITKHPRYGRNLYLIRDASDRDLNRLYNICSALIIASLAEGFGLPIVEAFNHGAPVLCSDIPVFREVAGERAEFFELNDPTVLYELVIKQAELFQNSNHSRYNGRVAWLTWRESAEQLFLRLVALAR